MVHRNQYLQADLLDRLSPDHRTGLAPLLTAEERRLVGTLARRFRVQGWLGTTAVAYLQELRARCEQRALTRREERDGG